MQKSTLLILLAIITLGIKGVAVASGNTVESNKANDNHQGHVVTIYGVLVRDIFGECVHTLFYNPETDALSECGEVPSPRTS